MAPLKYTHCRHCSERLTNHDAPYCSPCNLHLAYRALPILLGMLLLGHPAPAPVPVKTSAQERSS